MRCPNCGYNETKVTDSRRSAEGIRRRRECLECNRRFSTLERLADEGFFVLKKSGQRERFTKDKLLTGIRKACEKRPLPAGAAEAVASKVEGIIKSWGIPEVSSSDLGRLVLAELRKLDQIAYLRFASVHLGFSCLEDLRAEIEAMGGQKESPVAIGQNTLWPTEQMEGLTRNITRFQVKRKRGRPKGKKRAG